MFKKKNIKLILYKEATFGTKEFFVVLFHLLIFQTCVINNSCTYITILTHMPSSYVETLRKKLQDCKVEDALILSGLYNWLEIRAIEAADDFDCSSCPYFYDGVFAPT